MVVLELVGRTCESPQVPKSSSSSLDGVVCLYASTCMRASVRINEGWRSHLVDMRSRELARP